MLIRRRVVLMPVHIFLIRYSVETLPMRAELYIIRRGHTCLYPIPNSAEITLWTTTGGAIYNAGMASIYNTVFNDNNVGKNDAESDGGAIINVRNNLYVGLSTFSGNSANGLTQYGGAIFSVDDENSTTSFFLDKSTFNNNISSVRGGAVYVNHTNTTIYSSTFNENTSGQGGALAYLSDGSTYLNIYDSVFTSNTAKQGGGAIRYPSDYSAIQQVKPMRITGSTFTENKSANLGGAIFTQYDAYVTSSIFKGNSANINGSSEGGAIYSSAKLVILDSVFGAEDNGNSAKRGGALTLNGVANIVGSTFNSNTAKTDDAGDGGYGAAIYVRNLSYINSSSFTSNIADRQAGAVLSTASTQYINNSVFTGNKALDTDDSNGGGAIFTNTGSTISISNSTFSRQ